MAEKGKKKCCDKEPVDENPENVLSDAESNAEDGNYDESNEAPGVINISEAEKDALDLDFQHCRIHKIENLETLTSIETLGFRWNLIKKIENLQHLVTLQVESFMGFS